MVKFLTTLCAAFLFASFVNAQTLESDDIRKSFNDYKAAVLESNGEKAVKFVNRNTIDYYHKILGESIAADSLAIDKMEMVDKLMILMIRQSTSLDDLETMDGNSLFVFAVDKGMVGKNSVQNNSIGKVEVDGDYAQASLVTSGTPTQSAFEFHLEDGIWKIDLTTIFPEAEVALQSVAKSSGKSENDYIMMIIEFVKNEKPKENIWKPL